MTPNQKNVVAVDTLDILFEHRNKLYGAFELRRSYPRHLARALSIGIALVAGFIVLPFILTAVRNVLPHGSGSEVVVTLAPPPELEKPLIPPPVVPPTPPQSSRPTQRFVPPVVTIDENAPDDLQKTVDDVLNDQADVAAKNQTGDREAPPTDDDQTDFGRVIDYQPPAPDDGEYSPIDVQKMPDFPGGVNNLLSYLAEHIRYPALARENNIQGTVALSFVVNKDGSISDVSVLKDIGGGCAKEAIRVVMAMPRWTPGEANGHPVKVRFTLPVRFRLQ